MIYRKHLARHFLIGTTILLALAACATQKAPIKLSHTPKHHLTTLWTTKVGYGSSDSDLSFKPAVAHGIIYTADQSGLISAVKATDGSILWQRNLPNHASSSLAVAKHRIYVNVEPGTLYVLNKKNGKIIWKKPTANIASAAPAIANDKVFIKTIDGFVEAFNANNGKSLWRYHRLLPDMVLRGSSAPTVEASHVIAGFADGAVLSLDANSGNVQWAQAVGIPMGSDPMERLVDIKATPVIDHNRVYVVSYQGELQAIDLAKGESLWAHDLSSKNDISVHNKTLFVTDLNGYVWAFHGTDGRVNWRQEKLYQHKLTAPTLFGKYVVVADERGDVVVMAQDDGHIEAFTRKYGSIYESVAVIGAQKITLLNAQGELQTMQFV